jgi:hypothetical protein
MIDYILGKIYKIECNKTKKIYIGSTCEYFLDKRLLGHKTTFQRYKENKTKNYLTSFEILENDDYKILLLENYPCNNKNELHQRERYYIETHSCVNKKIPLRTSKEYYEYKKDSIIKYHKDYYINNKNSINEKYKLYYQKNREQISTKNRLYQQNIRKLILKERSNEN